MLFKDATSTTTIAWASPTFLKAAHRKMGLIHINTRSPGSAERRPGAVRYGMGLLGAAKGEVAVVDFTRHYAVFDLDVVDAGDF